MVFGNRGAGRGGRPSYSRGRGGRGGSGSGGGRGKYRAHPHPRASAPLMAADLAALHGVADEMAEETDAFFSDLTGARASRAAAATASNGATASARSTTGATGSSLSDADGAAVEAMPGDTVHVRPGQAGSQQTQDKVMWLELGLCKALVRAVSHLGFLSPTPVQAEAIPPALAGSDVCARAVTGSGKTAAFLLPLAHLLLTRPPQKASMTGSKRRFIRALVLLPTRELGVQCQGMLSQLLQFTTGLTVALAIGGVAPAAQEAALDAVPDILIATPGRLVDYVHNYRGGAGLDLTGVEVVVLDECDKMLTVTLRDQVVDIIEQVPVETRQMLMFSATMTEDVDTFAKEQLYKPINVDIGHVALQAALRQQFVRIRITDDMADATTATSTAAAATDPDNSDETGTKAKRIRSKRLREAAKEEKALAGSDHAEGGGTEHEHITKVKSRYVVALCQNYFTEKAMIFCRYRTTTHRLALLFNALGLTAVEVQGNQPQEERFAALQRFSAGEVRYLITTDVASRGLDLKEVATVINYDLPPTLTAYIHRVGRTARIGTSGTAVSLVHEVDDAEIMRKILAVSGAINQHQVSSVKRRDIPPALLKAAASAIDDAFPAVRAQLAAEQLEERIAQAEKRYSKADSNFVESLVAKPKREWCLSREERKARETEARQVYEKEAEVTLNHFQNELANLEREETGLLQRQKQARRVEREKREREAEKVKARAKELRKKTEKKLQAGVVKKLKRRKMREAVREKRAVSREKNGRAPFQHGDGKKRMKKSRHSTRVKRH